MKTNVKKPFNVRQLVVLGLMTALVMIFSFTPIGSIPVGPLVITLNVIPVAVAGITCGPLGGGIIGGVFGLFSFLQSRILLGGDIVDITPAPEIWGPFILNSVIYDHYACYDSFNKIMALAEREEPKWFLTGHDMCVVNQKYFGWDGVK